MKEKIIKLADELRKEGLNFIIVIEDEGIHSQWSIKGNSVLREIAKMIKNLK